jgi:hypothetical protein
MAVQNRPLLPFVLRRTGRRLTKDRAHDGTGDADDSITSASGGGRPILATSIC